MQGRRQWQPTPVLLPGKSRGQKSLVSYSPWGCKEWNTTEWLHFHFSFSCTGEGNGNPLQYSCLENPRDRGAWWPAVYEFTQIRTRLTWLSSSNRSRYADDTLFMAESTELKSHMIKVKEECEKAGFKNSTFKKKIMASIPTLRVYPNSCPLSRWCHPTISSSVIPFSSCLQSFPASGSFQMSQLYAN